MVELSGKQRRYLRALGHHLNAVVQIGHEGVSDAVAAEAERQLEIHELIKVKIAESSPVGRHEAAQLLAEQCEAEVAQVLGRTALLYRARKDKPGIELPAKR